LRPLKPEERAGLHRVALLDRAALRAEAAENDRSQLAEPPGPIGVDEQRDRRALFAAAVARAEFGRFYWKEEVRRRKKRRRKRLQVSHARPE
jgi:hypothetical protein